MILESEDRSQEAEKVSGPRDMLKREIFEAEKIAYLPLEDRPTLDDVYYEKSRV